MPGFVKPEWKTIRIQNNSYAGACLNEYMAHSTDTIEYEGETITKLDYIKQYLFDGKYANKIQFVDEGACPGSDTTNNYHIFGLYLDKLYNDRAAFFASQANGSYPKQALDELGYHCLKHVPDYKNNYSSNISLLRDFIFCANGGTMYVRNFDTFCVIWCQMDMYVKYNIRNTTSYFIIVYDFTNHELISFDGELRSIQFSKQNYFTYSKPLTRDGSDANVAVPYIRKQSTNEISYCKFKLIDGTEATRFYMLTQFPVSAEGAILTLQNKKLYVLPYQGDNWCAMAVECTADVTGE